MKKIIKFMILIVLIIPTFVSARRGCCSHHGGVAGCNANGRQICNDGTLSPTCTCTPTITYTYGCTDKNAKNYNARANKNDGSCQYYKKGCTDSNALNYDKRAEKDDGSCIIEIRGCMDENAKNYNKDANVSDDSCEYAEKEETNEMNPSTNFAIFLTGATGYYIYKKKKTK